jgi:hypothetical protein
MSDLVFRVTTMAYDEAQLYTHIDRVKDMIDEFVNNDDEIKIRDNFSVQVSFCCGILILRKRDNDFLKILSTKLYDFTELKQYIMSRVEDDE